MRKISLFAVLLSTTVFAAPVQDGETTIVQDDQTSLVTITYGFKNEPAIVTVDVQTNGPSGYASVDQTWLTNVVGDVNRKIAAGKNKTITWQPFATVPGRFRAKDARAVVTLHATNSPPDYIVLDLSDKTSAGEASVRFFPNAGQIPLGVTDRIYKTRYYVMRRIHAAGVVWPMGAAVRDSERTGNEIRHSVALPEDYYLGIYEVTQGHMRNVGLASAVNAQCNTGVANADYCPAAGVDSSKGITHTNIRGGNNWPAAKDHSYANAWAYLQYFRNRCGAKFLFDIPTDAQWEYAARAGAYATSYAHGKNSSDGIGDYAWYAGNVPQGTTIQEVGTRLPNAWGLYDMFGNAAEWCLDNFLYNCGMNLADYDDVDFAGPAKDYQTGTDYKVVRGGSYADEATCLRSAYRLNKTRGTMSPTLGFRLFIQAVYPY